MAITPVQVEVKMTSNKGEAVFTVTDNSDGLPIEGATVNLGTLGSGATDAAGKYSTGLVNKGTYAFSVSKPNYATVTGGYVVIA